MRIGYANGKLQKVCEETKAARKYLKTIDPKILIQRIGELAAYDNLAQVPIRTPPLHYHPLRANLAGRYAVTVQGLMRVIFVPAGDFQKLDNGTPDLSTVTAIEIVAVKDYHDK